MAQTKGEYFLNGLKADMLLTNASLFTLLILVLTLFYVLLVTVTIARC